MQRCPSCNEENPDRFRLCGYCGTTLEAALPPEEVRKTVTIVFCDLKGSTSLGESLDSEALREVLAVYFAAMKEVLERHGGTVEKYIGDAIMAVFGLPRMHEDDALRAVRATLEMEQALRGVNETLERSWGVRLQNRTGVNTGEVVAGDAASGQRLATGDTVNVAARLEQAAPECQVLIGDSTYRLVRDVVEVEEMEPLELKGKAERVPAYRLVSVNEGEAISRRIDLPMVGRDQELSTILDVFGTVVTDSTPRLVTVLAHPGIGKSRLIEEVLGRTRGEARILRGRCLSYGDGATFWPVAELVRQAAGVVAEDNEEEARGRLSALVGETQQDLAERLASLTGLSAVQYPKEELSWAIGSLLQQLGREGPVVAVVDDIHWAEPTLLELIEHVAKAGLGVPLLVLCGARHELLEERSNWGEAAESAIRLELSELSPVESAAIARNLLGTPDIPVAVEERILELAGGNPLFVEQTLSMLVDEGIFRAENGRLAFVGPLEAVSVPPNISSLLAARLDRLSPSELGALQHGSVVGMEFSLAALQGIGEDPASADGLTRALRSLCGKHLLRPGSGPEDENYEFSHILVRDSAYERLLKRSRARLHERFAGWLAASAGDRVIEIEEILGYHLEQAFRCYSELGPLNDDSRAVGARAFGHLEAAGHRALARGDLPAAANLLRRCAALLGADDRRTPRYLIETSDALMEMGQFSAADEVLTEAAASASASGDRAAIEAASLCRMQLKYITDGAGETFLDEVEARVSRLEAEKAEPYCLMRAWRLLAHVHGSASRFGKAGEAVEQTIRYARAAGDDVMARRFMGFLANAALYGPMPVAEAARVCESVIAGAEDDRKSTALAELMLAHLEAMRGDFGRARALYRKSRGALEEFDWKMLAALTSLDSAVVEMLAGDLDAAERELKKDYASLEEMQERNYISTTAALLADVLYRKGNYADASHYVEVAETIASEDDVASQFLWRCVRGKLLARAGEARRAEHFLTEAIALIAETDQLDWEANGLMDLAEVQLLLGGAEAAALTAGLARDLYERKGNLVALERAANFPEGIAAGVPESPPAPLSAV